jgi:hypothetical protein
MASFHFRLRLHTENLYAFRFSRVAVYLSHPIHVLVTPIYLRVVTLFACVGSYDKAGRKISGLGSGKNYNKQTLRGLSPQANYTDRATAACRRSYRQLLRIEGVTGSAQRIPTAVRTCLNACYTSSSFMSRFNKFILKNLS